jgi:methylthioribose-1-phosphate isomerase
MIILYRPWEVIKKFTHKTDPTTTNCDLLNTILDNIERDASTAAESVKHSKSDNITKAERLAIQQLRNNKQIKPTKAPLLWS